MLTEHPARYLLVPLAPFAVPTRGALHVAEDETRFVDGAFTSTAVIADGFTIRSRPDLRCCFAAHGSVFLFLHFGATGSGFPNCS